MSIGVSRTTSPYIAGEDFPLLLKSLKDYVTYILYNMGCVMEVQKVFCFAWQYNNILLGLSTIHTMDEHTDFIEWDRRRPIKTSTNASIVRPGFGEHGKRFRSLALLTIITTI